MPKYTAQDYEDLGKFVDRHHAQLIREQFMTLRKPTPALQFGTLYHRVWSAIVRQIENSRHFIEHNFWINALAEFQREVMP